LHLQTDARREDERGEESLGWISGAIDGDGLGTSSSRDGRASGVASVGVPTADGRLLVGVMESELLLALSSAPSILSLFEGASPLGDGTVRGGGGGGAAGGLGGRGLMSRESGSNSSDTFERSREDMGMTSAGRSHAKSPE